MPRKKNDNAQRFGVFGDGAPPTSVGDTVDEATLIAMRRAVKAAKRAAKRAERQENVDAYNARLARRSVKRGGRRDG